MDEPTPYQFKVQVNIAQEYKVSEEELDKLFEQGPATIEQVRKGARARMTGAFILVAKNQLGTLIELFESEFDTRWGAMIDEYKKRRQENGKVQ